MQRLVFLALFLPSMATFGCSSGSQVFEANSAAEKEEPDVTDVPNEVAEAAAQELQTLELRAADGRKWTVTGDPLTDQSAPLETMPGHNAFWFAWSVYKAGTEVWASQDPISGSVPAGNDECAVPCEEIIAGCNGRDCIPALTDPVMVPAADDAAGYINSGDIVLAVKTSQGPRAYPHNILWWHEIVNEQIGDTAYSVTFCPLAGTGILFSRDDFVSDATVELGVSGYLYNSTLIMYDRTSETLWSQLRYQAVKGELLGNDVQVMPVFEMTWAAWKSLYPDSLVMSADTGHSRDYTRYPYGDYRTDHDDTFRTTNPAPDSRYQGKEMVFGLAVDGETRAYPWAELSNAAGAVFGLIEDEIAGKHIALVFHLDAYYVHAFDLGVAGLAAGDLTLESR